MELYILNQELDIIGTIDSYKSLIWTKRYFTAGDFELYVPANMKLLEYLKIDNFIIRDDDDTAMIIEKIEIETSVENGDFIIVSGRSLESILSRRIIYNQTNINAAACAATLQLVKENAAKDWVMYAPRGIPNLIVNEDTTNLVSGKVQQQWTGDNLLDVIVSIAERYGFGWRIRLNDKQMIYECYLRDKVDVTFSPEFDNLIGSKYVCDYTKYKNLARIAGEGEGISRFIVNTYFTTNPWGLDRHELFVDARDVSSNDGKISAVDYGTLLVERGLDKLNENQITQTFECEVNPNLTYKYKADYDVGNIVTVSTNYGITASTRILEIIESYDETGYNIVLTFVQWEV